MTSNKKYKDLVDNVYYDIVVTNAYSTTSEPPNLYFNQYRNTAFVENAAAYYVSIIRFSLDTGNSIPVWIPTIQPNQNDINLTIYSCTLTFEDNGINYIQQTFLEWIPQDESVTKPTMINGIQNNTTGYYNAYSYQYLIFLVNLMFSKCFDGLMAQVIAAGSGLPSYHQPVMTWDVTSNSASIFCDSIGYDVLNDSLGFVLILNQLPVSIGIKF